MSLRVGRDLDRRGRPLRDGRRGCRTAAPAPFTSARRSCPSSPGPACRGGTWLDIWLPAAGRADRQLRHCGSRRSPTRGELLGLIVVERAGPTARPFTEEDDRSLTELARQVGLALHNVQLDSALQAVAGRAAARRTSELQESRARIVAAGDAERRKLERNLHDGAQQHLVALAVKLRLAEDAVEDDPDDAMTMIDELAADLQDAIAELRALAHGIFPPLLVVGRPGRGAAGRRRPRAALPTTVDIDGVGRYGPEIEAAVYFCCLEAMQNAGKHAGDGRRGQGAACAEADGELRFEVRDDGDGFELDGRNGQRSRLRQHGRPAGHGRRPVARHLEARRRHDDQGRDPAPGERLVVR